MMAFLTETIPGKLLYTALWSMVPVAELRVAIPFGHNALGLGIWPAFFAAVIGNLLPIPFLIVYTRRVLAFLRRRLPRLDSLVDRLERKAHLKGKTVTRYGFLGLCILVAIPLPGTGAWTGALVAAFLDMRLRKAMPAIALGVVIAGIIVSLLTFGVNAVFLG